MKFQVPTKFKPIYSTKKRYIGLEGGRGSGKSWAIVDWLLVQAVNNPNLNVVCLREIQRSIKYSSKKLIEDRIAHHKLNAHFDVFDTEIKSKMGTGVFIFNGMQTHTIDSIKSLEGFNIAFVEESQTISARSVELLIPTIRAEGSQLLFSWNRTNEDDAVEELFRDNDDALMIEANYIDNAFCPTSIRAEAEAMRAKNYEDYLHIYMGGYRTRSEAQIFQGRYVVEAFKPDKSYGHPLHGLDFGFSVDPTAGVKLYIKDNILYIHQEAVKVGLDIDDTAQFVMMKIPKIEDYALPCDSARPESISYLKRHGLPRSYSVAKWAGSVEDGIEFMKTFDNIVIHPQCKSTIKEFGAYSYKIDKRTDDVLPDIIDADNHVMDAIRYALGKMIKRTGEINSFKVEV